MNIKVNIKFLMTIASIIIMLFLMSTFSLGTEEYSVFVSLTSNSTLKEGELVNVNLNLNNINAGNGIDVIVAKLDYDNTIFETLSANDFNSNTGWRVSYSPITNMLTAIKDSKVKQNETAFSINFRVKSIIDINSTQISLQNITVSGGSKFNGGTDDIYVNDVSLTIKKPVQEIISTPNTNYSVSMSLTHSTPFKEGHIVTVYANLASVNAGDGIDVIVAKLDYDNTIFEALSANDFNSNTGWRVSYSPNTNMLTAIKDSKVKQNETVFSINLRVKSIIDINSTQISLQNITVSGGSKFNGGTDDIYVNNAILTLDRVDDEITQAPTKNVNTSVECDSHVETSSTVTETTEINISDIDSNIDNDIFLDSIDDIATDEIIAAKVDDLNVDEDIKISDTPMQISNIENDNSEVVERVIIGSASSMSFVSLAYVLLRKLLCGI